MGEHIDENIFNMAIRSFLKEVGVTSQREIEIAVREAIRSGRLRGGERLRATAVITIEKVGLRHEVGGEIATR
jgi:3-oxoacyl-[acyl-carrier-protein] synthase III